MTCLLSSCWCQPARGTLGSTQCSCSTVSEDYGGSVRGCAPDLILTQSVLTASHTQERGISGPRKRVISISLHLSYTVNVWRPVSPSCAPECAAYCGYNTRSPLNFFPGTYKFTETCKLFGTREILWRPGKTLSFLGSSINKYPPVAFLLTNWLDSSKINFKMPIALTCLHRGKCRWDYLPNLAKQNQDQEARLQILSRCMSTGKYSLLI